MFNDIQRIDDRGRIHAVGQRDLGREDRGGLEGLSRPVSGFPRRSSSLWNHAAISERVWGDATQPVADLIIAQPRFTLAAMEAFFNAMFGLGDVSELLERGVGGGVRVAIVVLEGSFRQTFACEEQDFLRTRAAGRCASLDAAHLDVDLEWSLLAIARGPSGLGLSRAPAIDMLPRQLRMASAHRVFRRNRFRITDQRVRGNRQQKTLIASLQSLTKRPAAAHFIVTCDSTVRQKINHFRRASPMPVRAAPETLHPPEHPPRDSANDSLSTLEASTVTG